MFNHNALQVFHLMSVRIILFIYKCFVFSKISIHIMLMLVVNSLRLSWED